RSSWAPASRSSARACSASDREANTPVTVFMLISQSRLNTGESALSVNLAFVGCQAVRGRYFFQHSVGWTRQTIKDIAGTEGNSETRVSLHDPGHMIGQSRSWRVLAVRAEVPKHGRSDQCLTSCSRFGRVSDA